MKSMDELVAEVRCLHTPCPHGEDYHTIKARELDLVIMHRQLDRLELRLDAFENRKQA